MNSTGPLPQSDAGMPPRDSLPPQHGGRLRQAAAHYQIPLTDWLDLSTGINPQGWPVPTLPPEVWQRLPEESDGLEQAAESYYGSHMLAVAGSQAAIQTLPALRGHSRVGILSPCYAEHAYNWRTAGHSVVEITSTNVERKLEQLDVLIVINPNNPNGESYRHSTLRSWHQRLASRGGWLVVDEAFIDCQPSHSLLQPQMPTGLVVLRSLGKFFGLAGLRVGFVAADASLRQQLALRLGPWSVSTPSRWVAIGALQDTQWQQNSREELTDSGLRLTKLLNSVELTNSGCELFRYVQTSEAKALHESLAKRGILTRLFEQPAAVRFGLPNTTADWQRLTHALQEINLAE